MKYMKFVLLFFCSLTFSLNINAKEEKYGNVTLRSNGNIQKGPTQQRVAMPNNVYNSNNMSHGVLQQDVQNRMYMYEFETLNYNDFETQDNTPFAENQQKTVQRAFGGGSNPLHPGVPVGDALPFMLLLTGIYVYIRNKK